MAAAPTLIEQLAALRQERSLLDDRRTDLLANQTEAIYYGMTNTPVYTALLREIDLVDGAIWHFNYIHNRGDLNAPLPALPVTREAAPHVAAPMVFQQGRAQPSSKFERRRTRVPCM